MKAYSQYDPEVGYVQGMNYIGMLLLTYVDEEEDAFWMFSFVMQEKNWREIFGRKKNKIGAILRDLEIHIRERFPALHERFLTSDYLSMEQTFTTHIITLFIYDAQIEIAASIFSLFLIDGCQVIVDLSAALVETQFVEMMRIDDLALM